MPVRESFSHSSAIKRLHVIGPPSWVVEEFRHGLERGSGGRNHPGRDDSWHISAHDGLSPVIDLTDGDGLWSSPGSLIALGDWRRRAGLPRPRVKAPPADVMARLPYSLTRHHIVVAHARDILSGQAFTGSPSPSWTFPDDLEQRPWSRVASGRVGGFRAARRTATDLRTALSESPGESLIEISENVEGLVEEWCAIVDPADAAVLACCGTCVHRRAGGADIITVFDGARFEASHRAAVMATASTIGATLRAILRPPPSQTPIGTSLRGSQGSGVDTATSPPPVSLLLAFRGGSPEPVVLEIDPVWCTTPYPFGPKGMNAFADAIRRCRVDASSSAEPFEWIPDPWMTREFARRYRGFPTPVGETHA